MTAELQEPDAEAPRVVAEGLGMRTREGWVYRHVDLAARPGDVVEVRGAGGTGRSMLLLTLTGRARHSTGTLHVLGHDLPHGARAVRDLAAVARLDRVAEPEEQHTVRRAFRERAHWDRVHPPGSDGLGYRVDEVRELTGLTAGPDERVESLPALQQTLLAVALAALARPRLLVLDDLDRGLPPAEQAAVWVALHRVAEADDCLTVASSAGDGSPPGATGGRTVIELHPTHVEES